METSEETGIRLRLSAQRALWGAIPANLRAVSIGMEGERILFRCIFDGAPAHDERELLSVAATEIAADFWQKTIPQIEEQYLEIAQPGKMEHLKYLVYLRYEANE